MVKSKIEKRKKERKNNDIDCLLELVCEFLDFMNNFCIVSFFACDIVSQ
jgi:hypothetical protein